MTDHSHTPHDVLLRMRDHAAHEATEWRKNAAIHREAAERADSNARREQDALWALDAELAMRRTDPTRGV